MTFNLIKIFRAFHKNKLRSTVEDWLDSIWLSQYLTDPQHAGIDNDESETLDIAKAEDSGGENDQGNNESSSADGGKTETGPRTFLRETTDPHDGWKSIKMPVAPSLPNPLTYLGSLRPFKRHVFSKSRVAFDEDDTVYRIAEEGIWAPSLKPEKERWLDIELIFDDSTSTIIWRDTVKEFYDLLKWTGAFRNIRTWQLNTDDETPHLYLGFNKTLGARNFERSHLELGRASGQTLIILMSDCISKAWQNGNIYQVIDKWASDSILVILQMLPIKMWIRTALRFGEPVKLSSYSPAITNRCFVWKSESILSVAEDDESRPVPIPVINLEPDFISRFAELTAGIKGGTVPGRLFYENVIRRVNKTPYVKRVSSPDKCLKNFLLTASPSAIRLAHSLAHFPDISYQVLKYLREEQNADLTDLAMVLLSGILKVKDYSEHIFKNDMRYEFRGNIQEYLKQDSKGFDSAKFFEFVTKFFNKYRNKKRVFGGLTEDSESMDGGISEGSKPLADATPLIGRPGKGRKIKQGIDELQIPDMRDEHAVINWLHFSDLHAGIKDQNWQWPVCREEFLRDLTRMHEIVGGFDLILFTGDLAFKGRREDFEKAEKVLTEIMDHLHKLGSSPLLLAVPGNHDLIRQDALNPISLAMSNWQTNEELRDHFWETKRSDYRKFILKAFEPFIEFRDRWIQHYKYRESKNIALEFGELPGDFFATVRKNGLSFGLAGFNSAFLQISGGDANGKLEISPRQFNTKSMGCDFPEWINRHHANLLMTHHPPNWLYPDALETFQTAIHVPQWFAAHVCGHCHESEHFSIKVGGTEARTIIQGASLFGSKKLNSGKKSRIHGYNAGQISIENNKGTLKIWPRQVDLKKGNIRVMGPDNTLPFSEKDCILNEFRPLKSCESSVPPDSTDGKEKEREPVVLYYGGRGSLEKKIKEISQSNKNAIDIDLSQFSEDFQVVDTFLLKIIEEIGDEKEKTEIKASLEEAKEDADRRFGAFKYEPTMSPHVLDPWSQHYMGHAKEPLFIWLTRCLKDRPAPFIFLFDHFERISNSLQWMMEYYLFPMFNSLENIKCKIFYKGNQQPSWKTFATKDYVEIKAGINPELAKFRNPYIVGRPIRPLQSNMLYGRRDILDSILRGLSDGRNAFAISAESKIGKSSFLLNLRNLIPENHSEEFGKYLPIYLSLDDIEKPAEKQLMTERLMWLIAYEMHKAIQREVVIDLPVPLLKDFLEMPIKEFNDGFLEKIFEQFGDEKKILLLIDEFDAINNWIEEGEEEPEFFRFLSRQFQHQDRLAFIFSGSMKLKKLVDRFPKFFNPVRFLEIGLLSEEDTRKLILSPVKDVLEYEPKAVDDILSMSGMHPYITQAICHTIVNQARKYANPYMTSRDLEDMAKIFLKEAHGVFALIWNSCCKMQQHLLVDICASNVSPLNVELDEDREKALESLIKKNVLRNDGMFVSRLFYSWVKEKKLANECSPENINADFENSNIHDIIKNEESETLEYKSSVRWDYKKNAVNKSLEKVMLKSVAGFLNADGGKLVIGLDDEKNVVGLEKDYHTLKKKDRDGYHMFIKESISKYIGKELCPQVHIKFYSLDNKDVCLVAIEPSPKPVYIREGNDNIFYLRTGNATQRLDAKEAAGYISTRF